MQVLPGCSFTCSSTQFIDIITCIFKFKLDRLASELKQRSQVSNTKIKQRCSVFNWKVLNRWKLATISCYKCKILSDGELKII